MDPSDDVRGALLGFYEAFSSGDPAAFAAIIASGPGVSVIGSEPGVGARGRESWVDFYAKHVSHLGWTLRAGDDPSGYAEGTVGFASDTPTAVAPDGGWIPTRVTAVVHQEDGEWKIVHVHVSVGVPDEDVLQPPA